MYPVSATSSAAASSGALESGGDSSDKEGTIVQGSDLHQIESSPAPTKSKRVSTEGVRKASVQKHSASVAVSSSAFTVDLDVLSSLGVELPPESAQIIENLFYEMNALAMHTYKIIVVKQLPPGVSDKLSVAGRAIWYFTYKAMCEVGFVSRCIGEYHSKHRPNFIGDLRRIRELLDSTDSSALLLTGDRLLDFLSRLDCAIHSNVKSVFNSNWSEVSVAMEEETLNSISCKDFVDVLEIAGIPQLASSAMSEAVRYAKKNKGHASSVGDYDAGSSLGSSAAEIKRRKGKDGVCVPISTHDETGVEVVRPTVLIPHVFSETSTLAYSAVFLSSSSVSFSVECVDLLDVKLHSDSARFIRNLLYDIRKFAKISFAHSIPGYISTVLNSKLTVLGKAIWLKTYKELHLSKFMCKFFCTYHYRYYPNFIRALDNIRVLSSSSDTTLVPLSGVGLLDFLSKLDCSIRESVESMFNSEWDGVANGFFSKLEYGAFSTVSCEDFIEIISVVGVPVVALSNFQRYDKGKYRKRATDKVETSGSGTIGLARSSTFSPSNSRILNSLGVTLLPESARVIVNLFFKIHVFARRIYNNTINKQLPPSVSDKLTATGRAIWYRTCREMCENSFVFKCLGEYYYKHCPGFIRALPSIRVLSDSADRNVVPLVGDKLLDFLLKLECVIRSEVKSIFNSCWNEVSVSLERSSFNAVSCKDFIDVLDIAGIPQLALSVMLTGSSFRGKNKDSGKCTASNVTGIANSSSSSSQSLPHQSNPELLPSEHNQSESQLRSSLPLGGSAGTSYELALLSFVGDFGDTSSSDQCVDLLGFKFNPDSAKLVYRLFFEIRRSARMSFSRSILNYVLSTLNNSELSVAGKAIWCKTYRELHLSRFIYRSVCMYHAKYRPDFIRALDSIRVLSSSSDCGLVPLSGSELLDFISRLDSAIHEVAESVFNLWWDEVVDRFFSKLENVSLSDVNCGDFVRVLDVVGIPVAAFSISQVNKGRAKKLAISECKTSKSGIKFTIGAKDSGSSIIDLTHSSAVSISQLKSELSSRSELLPKANLQSETHSGSLLLLGGDSGQSSTRFVKSSYENKSADLSVADIVSTVVASPEVTESSLPPPTIDIDPVPRRSASHGSITSGSETSGSSGKCAYGTDLVSSTAGLTHSSDGISLPQLRSQPELSSQPNFGSSLSLSAETVVVSTVSDQHDSVSVNDTVSTVVELPGGTVFSSSIVTDSMAVSTFYGDSSLTTGGDVLASTVDVAASDFGVLEGESPIETPSSFSPAPLLSPPSGLGVADDVLSFSPSYIEDEVRLTAFGAAPAFWGLGDELLSPPSSPSILPSSSSSSSCLSSSPSESGLDADVSSFSS
ncbi:hypothetical protein [Candidatus Ichthyocystis sparus]|uniref:hypothetical protein n=5 Tax=Candidatus Ichthyocystis sparus TaxID=1561004 RepID=UPI000B853197|nr:hypothetical protein [Candidatus Ichthyocystis sparus]